MVDSLLEGCRWVCSTPGSATRSCQLKSEAPYKLLAAALHCTLIETRHQPLADQIDGYSLVNVAPGVTDRSPPRRANRTAIGLLLVPSGEELLFNEGGQRASSERRRSAHVQAHAVALADKLAAPWPFVGCDAVSLRALKRRGLIGPERLPA
jgi:hypothetical protein